VQRDLSSHLALLDRAAELSGAVRRPATNVAAAAALLDDAQALLGRQLPATRRWLDTISSRLRLVPLEPNPWAILHMERDEVRVTRVLRWLLDTSETHGLGDAFLRFALLRSASAAVRRLARSEETLNAIVLAEFAFDIGIPDLVIVLPGAIVVGEVKVDAAVHFCETETGETIPQTTAYRVDLTKEAVLSRLSSATGQSIAALRASERAFLFIAPDGADRLPMDNAYASLPFTELAVGLAGLLEPARLTTAQRCALAGVLTQFLRIAHDEYDGCELLVETRRFLSEPRHLSDSLALRARALMQEWEACGWEGLDGNG
jgi:hypothetical protein